MLPTAVVRRVGGLTGVLCLALCATGGLAPARAAFVTFESGQVRPLALSPDGNRLFARQHARTIGSRSSPSTAAG